MTCRGLLNKRLGLVIPVGEPRIDSAFEFFNAAEGATTDHAFRDQGEEAFHLIEPRTAGRSEVEMEVAALSGVEPPFYGGALVRAVVVQNDGTSRSGGTCFSTRLRNFANSLPR